jgi:hypothetical protein
MLLKCAQITIELGRHNILNFLLQQLASDTIFYQKNLFYGRVLKSIACVTLVRKAAEKRIIAIFLKILLNEENK